MKKSWLLAVPLFLQTAVHLTAQDGFSIKDIKIGPAVGVHYSKLTATKFPELLTPNQPNELAAVNGQSSWGVNVGLAYLLTLSHNFDIRAQSSISFQNTKIKYEFNNLENHIEKVHPVTVELPFHLIYTDKKDKYFMPSVLMGLRYIRNISNSKNNKLALGNNDFGIDVGAELFVKFDKFKMRPSFIYSFQGFTKSDYMNDIFNRGLGSLSREKMIIQICFYR